MIMNLLVERPANFTTVLLVRQDLFNAQNRKSKYYDLDFEIEAPHIGLN